MRTQIVFALLASVLVSTSCCAENIPISLAKGWTFFSLPVLPSVLPVMTTRDLSFQLERAGVPVYLQNAGADWGLRRILPGDPPFMLRPGMAFAAVARAPLTVPIEVTPAFPSQIVETVVGNGVFGFSGDGGPATSAALRNPIDLALGPDRTLYFADPTNACVRAVSLDTGIIRTVAGTPLTTFNLQVFPEDGTLATEAPIVPYRVEVDGSGTLYIVEGHGFFLKVDKASGRITRVAGGGSIPYDGQTGKARDFRFKLESYLVTPDGTIFMAQEEPGWIVRIPPGSDTLEPFLEFSSPTVLGYDPVRNRLWITEFATHVVGYVEVATRKIVRVGGVLGGGYSGDGGPALQARLQVRVSIALDKDGNAYVADADEFYTRRIDAATGIITTVSGDGFNRSEIDASSGRYFGDGGPAVQASFRGNAAVVLDDDGYLYIADAGNSRIRRTGPFPVGRAPMK